MIAQIDLQVQVQVPQDTAQPQAKDAQSTDSFRSLLKGMQTKSADADGDTPDKISGDAGKADLKKDAKAETSSALPQNAQTISAQGVLAQTSQTASAQAVQAVLLPAAQAGNHPQASVSPIPAQAGQNTASQTVPAMAQAAVPTADAAAQQPFPAGSAPVPQNGTPAAQSQAAAPVTSPKNTPTALQQGMAPEAVQTAQNIPAGSEAVQTAQIPQNTPTAPQKSTAAETAPVLQSIPTAAKQSTVPAAAQILQDMPKSSGQSTVSEIVPAAEPTVPTAQTSVSVKPVLVTPGETPAAETGEAHAEEKQPGRESGTPSAQPVPTFYTSGRVIVKVSDAAAAAKTPVGSQIANAVTDGLKAGKQQFQVDLYPQSLGKVSVNLVSQGGMLTVEIAAQNPKTQSLIASSSGEIRSLLHASTGQNVQVTNQQQNAQQYTGQNGTPFQQQQFSQQQQQQEDAEHRQAAKWYEAGNSYGFSTGDFLTALRKAAV